MSRQLITSRCAEVLSSLESVQFPWMHREHACVVLVVVVVLVIVSPTLGLVYHSNKCKSFCSMVRCGWIESSLVGWQKRQSIGDHQQEKVEAKTPIVWSNLCLMAAKHYCY